VSYQPEERYWTDYLRIALPVVGLLLMLGLFWYWASAVIGDDDNNEPTVRPEVTIITEPTPTATTQPQVDINPETVTPEPTQGGTQAPDSSGEEATEAPTDGTDEAAPGKGFTTGDTVVMSEEANLRVEGSLEADVIEPLPAGTELEVLGPGVESGGYIWIEVRVVDTEQEGFVADEFVEAAE
jgi:hypothetical protein